MTGRIMNANLLEAIATTFALEVPKVALLVLPTTAPVKSALKELRDMGVDARSIDLHDVDRGKPDLIKSTLKKFRSQPLRRPKEEADEEEAPYLLVTTIASVRGLDFPEMSHVFLAGIPEEFDDYLHAAGRVGRFGSEGKVVSFFEEVEEEKAALLYRKLKISLSEFEHMARICHLLLLFLLHLVVGQPQQSQSSSSSSSLSSSSSNNGGSSSSSSSSSPTASVVSFVTSVPVASRTIVADGHTSISTSFSPTTVISTIQTHSSTSTATHTSTSTTPSPTQPSGPVLDTTLDPGFGVLGALLILTVCLSLILKFGVLVAVHPPNTTLRGLFVLACGVAGIAGGGISIFFWQQTKYFIGAWGGFAVGLWVQTFRSGGLIHAIGFQWILYASCATVGFVLCTIPKLHYHTMILGTAFTGASAFMLGVDCFSTAGLKEFANTSFPLTQTMAIEIGLIAAVALAGTAIQLQVLQTLKRKLAEINAEEEKREQVAEEKAVKRFEHVQHDLDEWEKEHGSKMMKRSESDSATPLIGKDVEDPPPSTPGGESVTAVGHPRQRTRSGLSDYGMPQERPLSRFSQTPGLLPTMNLGMGLDSELPSNMVTPEARLNDPDLLAKESLLAEIQTIRRSIEALKSEGGSISGDSRRHSLSFHSRTLSGDLAQAQAQSASLGLPRPRERVRSMDAVISLGEKSIESLGANRPVSTPLKDDDWDAYLRERRLFQPPSGPSAPIAPTYVAPIPRPSSAIVQLPESVTEALAARKLRESAFDPVSTDDERVVASGSKRSPYAERPVKPPRRSNSLGPVTILPPHAPQASKPEPEATPAPRTFTYEELLERHQAKLRSLQEPVSKREREEAELAAVKARWEKRQAAEKEAMTRKLAEKEAARKAKDENRKSKGEKRNEGANDRPSSMSLDRLGGPGGKRLSTAKVEEWKKYQQGASASTSDKRNPPSASRRRPPADEQGVLPFPNTTPAPRKASATDTRRSRRDRAA
ncbi:hypothetical protein Clacol_003063 [Clathrus columnatus]|uniref:Helicase C-terminal domain-containing protein n=1 Tax=Clathrus columnatus TaxID=1419009 RepID=A0AAV5A7X0_9AGAM|nr:hypothetical protein Clacol_003063 [Clathrus columnatus]